MTTHGLVTKFHTLIIVACLLCFGGIVSTYGITSISIMVMTEDGGVHAVRTPSRYGPPPGTSTRIATFQDPDVSQDSFSPNGLGLQGRSKYAYATFTQPGNQSLFYNNVEVFQVPTSEFAIAAGTLADGSYYYVDSNGYLVRVDNFFLSPFIGFEAMVFSGGIIGDLGDLLVSPRGRTGYLSYGSSLSRFTFDPLAPEDGFTQTVDVGGLFVGLASDQNGALFGVRKESAADFDLYSIDGRTLQTTKIADISGSVDGLEITDAASVPDGGATLLLFATVLLGLRRLPRHTFRFGLAQTGPGEFLREK